ncbi:MAG: hypothetical protein WA876_12770 [Candidatus Acidiferrales bacterium]
MQPHAEDASAELLDEAEATPLPLCAAKVENWMVEWQLPHLGHSGWPFFTVTMRS